MGSEIIQPTEKEKKNKENYQRKIIAKNFIKKGQKINYNDIILLRTSNKKALPSSKLNKIIGRRSVINIKSGDPVYL